MAPRPHPHGPLACPLRAGPRQILRWSAVARPSGMQRLKHAGTSPWALETILCLPKGYRQPPMWWIVSDPWKPDALLDVRLPFSPRCRSWDQPDAVLGDDLLSAGDCRRPRGRDVRATG